MLVNILRLILLVLNDKNYIFRHKFYSNFSKSQFYENADENSIYVSFVFHLTISTLRHVYSFAYDRFNWYDGIRYSYISFCAKSASISLVDFSMDTVASKKSFRQKLKVKLKFISAIFTFDKNMKSSCIFAHSGNTSLVYRVRCWCEHLFCSLKYTFWHNWHQSEKLHFEPSQIATVTNCDTIVAICDLLQFVIKALTWHIDSNNTENVLWVLGRVPRITPAILRIWQEAHDGSVSVGMSSSDTDGMETLWRPQDSPCTYYSPYCNCRRPYHDVGLCKRRAAATSDSHPLNRIQWNIGWI